MMKLLVSGTTRSVAKLVAKYPHALGHLLTPSNRNAVLQTGLPWGVDNGAYNG